MKHPRCRCTPNVAGHACYLQIVVASKFDNRMKEFQERWEVDSYLAATGYLPAGVRPFFVALPSVSGLHMAGWGCV